MISGGFRRLTYVLWKLKIDISYLEPSGMRLFVLEMAGRCGYVNSFIYKSV